MKATTEFHMPAKVIAHLDGGFSRVKLLAAAADYGGDYPFWEIPTTCVPMSLRSIGCRIMVHYTAKHHEEGDSAEAIRAHQTDYVVEPLTEDEEKKLSDAPPKFWARLVDWPKKQK